MMSIAGAAVQPRTSPEQDFNYVSLEDIEAGTGRLFDPGPTLGRDIASTKTSFQAGDLLYGRLRPYLQKVIIAESEGVAATELLVLRVQQNVDTEFVQEVFLGPDHRASVSKLMSGARMPRVRAEQLLDLQIALPPLELQRVIVRGLSVLRHQVSSLRRRITDGLALVDQFERQLLSSAFDGSLVVGNLSDIDAASGGSPLTAVVAARRMQWDNRFITDSADGNKAKRSYPEPAALNIRDPSAQIPSTWAWASLEQLASATDPICYGIVEPGDEVEIGVPMVRIQDLASNGIDRKGMRRVTHEIDGRHPRSRLKGGEVLISLAGSIGRVARVPDDLAGANINRALAKVTPLDTDLGDWITLALQSPALQDWLTSSARGAARDILNLSRLVRAPVPLAPPAERVWLTRQLRQRLERVASMRSRFRAADVALSSLWSHLRAKVLAGDVTLSNPEDEAVAAARRTRISAPQLKRKGSRRKAKQVAVRKLKSGGPESRRNLTEVLRTYADGLEPLRLLEVAGYGLQDVELFFKDLADAVASGKIKEHRSDKDWPRLVVG
ncbi:hypothetical protein [uncultured Enterovirga sp.]|uniref:restriction endonuclease subunit S n=1 Tax=uncultured Enterovirga sp. TaxID=2026352 RepID=UPI0035CCA23C